MVDVMRSDQITQHERYVCVMHISLGCGVSFCVSNDTLIRRACRLEPGQVMACHVVCLSPV